VINPGENDSIASAIRKNDEPQMIPGMNNNTQSTGCIAKESTA
jgi:hypothetical protein